MITWKIGAGIGALATIGLGAALVFAKIENANLTNQIDKQTKQITALTSDLATSRGNQATLIAQINDQNAAIQKLTEQNAREQAEGRRLLALANEQRRAADARAAALLNRPISGDNLEARIRDVDSRFMESIK